MVVPFAKSVLYRAWSSRCEVGAFCAWSSRLQSWSFIVRGRPVVKSVHFVDCGAIAMAAMVMVRCLDGEGEAKTEAKTKA